MGGDPNYLTKWDDPPSTYPLLIQNFPPLGGSDHPRTDGYVVSDRSPLCMFAKKKATDGRGSHNPILIVDLQTIWASYNDQSPAGWSPEKMVV